MQKGWRSNNYREFVMRRLKFRYLTIAGLLLTLSSCRSDSKLENPANDLKSAASYISQADQMYAQREDLARLQQGIVFLRQATVADPNSYEAVWRLAKFNYYMATHIDGNVRDQKFRDGIAAGKTAVQLQGDKPEGHFWLGANYGDSLESETITGLASLDDVLIYMITCLSIIYNYQSPSPY